MKNVELNQLLHMIGAFKRAKTYVNIGLSCIAKNRQVDAREI